MPSPDDSPVDLYGLPALPPDQPVPQPEPVAPQPSPRTGCRLAWLGVAGAALVTAASAGVGAMTVTAVRLLGGG